MDHAALRYMEERVRIVTAMPKGWRNRLLLYWGVMKASKATSGLTMKEYKVRPGLKRRQCNWRELVSQIRMFSRKKPKNPVFMYDELGAPPAQANVLWNPPRFMLDLEQANAVPAMPPAPPAQANGQAMPDWLIPRAREILVTGGQLANQLAQEAPAPPAGQPPVAFQRRENRVVPMNADQRRRAIRGLNREEELRRLRQANVQVLPGGRRG